MGLFLAVLTSITTVSALAEANCTVPRYNWTFNSLGSTPCRVAEELFLPCNITLIVGPLDSNHFYGGTILPNSYPCWCNSVFYSLVSGCAICQGALLNHWSHFSKDCPKWWMTTYPLTIPAGVRVPHWAYLNVQTNDVFDPVAAASAVGSESTAPLPRSTTSPASLPIVTSSSASLLSTSTTVPVFSTSSITFKITSVFSTSNTPSISPTASPSVGPSPSGASRRTVMAAGVAGGIVTLGLVAGLIFCHRRRNIKALRKLLISTPYPYNMETQSETRKKPFDLHNDARVHVPSNTASSGVVNIGQSPGRF